MAGLTDDSVSRAGSGRVAPGDDADALALSDEAAPVGVRGLAVVTRTTAEYEMDGAARSVAGGDSDDARA